MKRVKIIFSALVVLFCLVPNTFAGGKGKYMLLMVDVKSGDVVDVFALRDMKDIDKSDKPTVKIKSYATHDIPPPFDIKGFKSDKAIGTFYSESSPGCRNVHIRSCSYRQVCD